MTIVYLQLEPCLPSIGFHPSHEWCRGFRVASALNPYATRLPATTRKPAIGAQSRNHGNSVRGKRATTREEG
jgi:hypothetical protein